MDEVNLKKLFAVLDSIQVPFGIVIGNFDGVHKGHEKHLENFYTECKKLNLLPVIITFNPHPVLFLKPETEKFLLNSHDSKVKNLSSLFDHKLITISFDKEIQSMHPKTFLQDYILKSNMLKLVHLGHDFKLGKGKENSKCLLEELVSSRDIVIKESLPLKVSEKTVSSTHIRELIKSDISKANLYLRSPFKLSGKVIRGEGNGKKIFVPTCNIKVDSRLCIPSSGVYITKVKFNGGVEYDSITNVGFNPTVSNSRNIKIETHLFFFDKEIYGEEIEVVFIDKVRSEKKFDTFSMLKTQILEDLEVARNYHREASAIKLGLIGKDISHSKSQDIYENILKKYISYELIDCKSPNLIPSLVELEKKYLGVSITSPYKKHFLKQIKLTNPALSSINTIVFKPVVEGVNTDYLACEDIIDEYISKGVKEFHVLGSGSMSEIIQIILKIKGILFTIYSRKDSSLNNIEERLSGNGPESLVINCCAREYTYHPTKDSKYRFWDLNYKMNKHIKAFSISEVEYQDGLELLSSQAKYALRYWKL